MKRILFIVVTVLSLHTSAQMAAARLPQLDKSPMDMSYYPSAPASYPILKIQKRRA